MRFLYRDAHLCVSFFLIAPTNTQVWTIAVTAGGKGYLKAQPLAKLRAYIQAYNISLGNDILEKDDVVNAMIAARVRSMDYGRTSGTHSVSSTGT